MIDDTPGWELVPQGARIVKVSAYVLVCAVSNVLAAVFWLSVLEVDRCVARALSAKPDPKAAVVCWWIIGLAALYFIARGLAAVWFGV